MQNRKSLFFSEKTDWQEILEFVKNRIQNPVVVEDKIIFDFNNHPYVKEPLRKCVLQHESKYFVIPYSMSAVWSFIVALLPAHLRTAPQLFYSPTKNEYTAIENPFLTLDQLEYRKIRHEIENLVFKVENKF